MRPSPRTLTLCAVLAASLGAPSAAAASELVRDGDALVLRGSPGEANVFGTEREPTNDPNRVHFYDRTDNPMAVDPRSGARSARQRRAGSPTARSAAIRRVRLEGGDQVDTLTMNPYDYPLAGNAVTLDGGAGRRSDRGAERRPAAHHPRRRGRRQDQGRHGPGRRRGRRGERQGRRLGRGGHGARRRRATTSSRAAGTSRPTSSTAARGRDRNEGDWAASSDARPSPSTASPTTAGR